MVPSLLAMHWWALAPIETSRNSIMVTIIDAVARKFDKDACSRRSLVETSCFGSLVLRIDALELELNSTARLLAWSTTMLLGNWVALIGDWRG